MRIIKNAEVEGHEAVILPMTFDALPEDGSIVSRPSGNGFDADSDDEQQQQEPQEPAIDIEEVKREADRIMAQARADADRVAQEAQSDAEQTRADAQQEAEQIRAQADSDAEQAKKEGYAYGYKAGEEDGYKKGYDDGFGKGKNTAIDETRDSVNMVQEVIEQLKDYHVQILADAQKDIAKMALGVARKILHKEIMTDPQTIVGVVKNALSQVSFKKRFVVHVNPLDLEVLKKAGEEVLGVLDSHETIKFKASPQVEAGGCVVQTESGTVDAQIDRQFQEVEDAVMTAIGDGEDEDE